MKISRFDTLISPFSTKNLYGGSFFEILIHGPSFTGRFFLASLIFISIFISSADEIKIDIQLFKEGMGVTS